MSLLDTPPIPRWSMILFFLINASDSMRSNKIAAVNNSMRNVIPTIVDISNPNPDTEIKIAVLTFSDDVAWVYPEPRNLTL